MGCGIGRGIPLPSRLGGLGERRELRPYKRPGRKRILAHFEGKGEEGHEGKKGNGKRKGQFYTLNLV